MENIDILGFNPKDLEIFNKDEKKTVNYNFNYFERKLNYPINDYYSEDNIIDHYDTVIYVYKELVRQSFEAIGWLRASQYAKKSEKEDTAHINKKNQILSKNFQLLFYSKFNGIVELTKRISMKLDTYAWEYDYYKHIMNKFIKYIVGDSKDPVLYEQAKTLVDGIMKITLSAKWDYNSKSFILENKPFSQKYILGNGKWTKTHS